MVKTCVQRTASSEILFAGQRESYNKLATANNSLSQVPALLFALDVGSTIHLRLLVDLPVNKQKLLLTTKDPWNLCLLSAVSSVSTVTPSG